MACVVCGGRKVIRKRGVGAKGNYTPADLEPCPHCKGKGEEPEFLDLPPSERRKLKEERGLNFTVIGI